MAVASASYVLSPSKNAAAQTGQTAVFYLFNISSNALMFDIFGIAFVQYSPSVCRRACYVCVQCAFATANQPEVFSITFGSLQIACWPLRTRTELLTIS